MKNKLLLLTTTLIALFLFTCTNPKTKIELPNPNWPGFIPIPKGYGYLTDSSDLKKAVANNDSITIREHSWRLFAALMQPSSTEDSTSWPLWFSWPNSVDAMHIPNIFDSKEKGLETLKKLGNRGLSLLQQNKLNTVLDTLTTPTYPIDSNVINMFKKKNVFNSTNTTIIPGKNFMFNGDIMIPTESISNEGYIWINANSLNDSTQLRKLKNNGTANLNAPNTYVVTKHMYWPVLKNQYNLIPVWNPGNYPSTYNGYAGYEMWNNFVAVNPNVTNPPPTVNNLSFLYGTYWGTTAIAPRSANNVPTHSIHEFYYHCITQNEWDNVFTDRDKAILMASSYWAYNKPIGPGDYLVTIAMHINTKEIYSWTMQSAWWTDKPSVGPYAQNRPQMPKNTKTQWHYYNIVSAYGIPVTGGNLPVAMNPYIELVIHPIKTNCNNCHMRAGFPEVGNSKDSSLAGYQNNINYNMLAKLYDTSQCFRNYMRTDFQWIIPDYAHSIKKMVGETK